MHSHSLPALRLLPRDMFLSLPSSVFFAGQLIYMFWNSINDPICGWISDRMGQAAKSPVQTRLDAIKYGGILWAMSFAGVWFAPPANSSSHWILFLHFCLSTCLYDTMLTLVEVNHSALLAELSVDGGERASYNGYAAVFAGAGSLTSFFGHFFWDRDHLQAFQMCCLGIALACSVVFVFSAEALRQTPSQEPSKSLTRAVTALQGGPVFGFISELSKQRNFWVFAIVATVQSFDCAFEKTSFAVVLDDLTSASLGKVTRGLFISSSFLLPWAGTLFVTPLVQTRGVYAVFSFVLVLRVFLCVVFWSVESWIQPQTIAVFLLVNRVASETVCRISPLVLSDLVDEDRYLHKRDDSETRSASVIGGAHFISKFVPLCCVLLQTLVWSSLFSLHGSYLRQVKQFVAGEFLNKGSRVV